MIPVPTLHSPHQGGSDAAHSRTPPTPTSSPPPTDDRSTRQSTPPLADDRPTPTVVPLIGGGLTEERIMKTYAQAVLWLVLAFMAKGSRGFTVPADVDMPPHTESVFYWSSVTFTYYEFTNEYGNLFFLHSEEGPHPRAFASSAVAAAGPCLGPGQGSRSSSGYWASGYSSSTSLLQSARESEEERSNLVLSAQR
ncbi:hypothetical protein RHGRI_012019 [Rhododendron griersonianum]|uniref:Uncharacterized protein n=1 Tax=Rhododendron griersonianum TaxID=479676 RepID=A0AAV6KP02_9ERIC|nr:hypothetical protein RHGRI_012019 [Rhododendron griersonianum]